MKRGGSEKYFPVLTFPQTRWGRKKRLCCRFGLAGPLEELREQRIFRFAARAAVAPTGAAGHSEKEALFFR